MSTTAASGDDVPDLVRRAEELAIELGFPLGRGSGGPSCCLPAIGRLLAMLAAGCRGGVIGEIGTGVGYGTAWMVSSMAPDATLVTFELDAGRARAAADLFADDRRIEVVHGDGSALVGERSPFDLLFADGGGYGSDAGRLRALVPLLSVGGRLVVDDVTPMAALPADSPFRRHDPKREAFFADDALASVELVTADLASAALVGTRLR